MSGRVAERALSHFNAGCQHLRDGRLDAAITQLSRAIFLDPSHDDFYHRRADAYLLCGDVSSAVRNYARALMLRPRAGTFMKRKVAAVLDVAGQARLDGTGSRSQRSEHALAQKRFSEASELDPANAIYPTHVAITHVSLGRIPQALRELNRAVLLDPNSPDILVLRARVHDLAGDADAAVLDVDMALELVPNHAGAIGYRRKRSERARHFTHDATMKIFLGDPEGALDSVTRAIALNPSDVEQLIKRAIVYRQLGLYEDAARDLGKAVQKAGGVHPEAQHQFCLTLNEIGVSLVRDGDLSEAIVYFDKAIKGNPSMPEFHINRGDAYRMQGQFDLARADYHAALELRPEDTDARLKLSAVHAEIARRLYNETEYDQAIYEVGLAIEVCPNIASYHVLRAECRILTNALEAAVVDLTRAVELRPDPRSQASRRLRQLCPNGLPPKASRALERGTDGDDQALAHPHHGSHANVSQAQEAHRKERKTLENFRDIKHRGDRSVAEMFDIRPDFSRQERKGTTVSLVLNRGK